MRHTWIGLVLASLALASCASGRDDDDPALEGFPGARIEAARDGVPTFVSGDLGRAASGKLDADSARTALPALLGRIAPLFRLAATDLRLVAVESDADGTLHARFQQLQYGLDVEGAEIIVHVDPRGLVYAANGSARGGATPSMRTRVAPDAAVGRLLTSRRYRGMSASAPRLGFVLDARRSLRLAWETTISGDRGGEPVEDRVFVDAIGGEVAATLPQVVSARKRSVHTVNNGQVTPGELRRPEGGAAGSDLVVNDVYDHLGSTYGCYQALYARDSVDGKGGALTGVVHYGVNLRNAFYRGSGVMVFGDGDGRNSGPFGGDLDIVAHELTHGVTRETSNLRYEDESGAINEGLSDVFGAICETWARGQLTADSWKIGEGSTTPGIPGDALRYMDNPTLDGSSTDYYPERYSGVSDYGGVHGNSGITNLAFKLLTTGGQHPRGKSDVQVPALGIERAGKIFYRANTTYLTSTSQYPDLRAATMFAAKELFGDAERDAVGLAFSAVGVGDPGRPVPPSSPFTLLTAGDQRSLSGKDGEEHLYAIDIPAGAPRLEVELSGGSGDLDLYVKRDASPTLYGSDHTSTNLGSGAERILVAEPPAGRYYLLVSSASDYAGVTLRARTAAAATTLESGRWVTLAGARPASRSFTVEVPAGAAGLVVELDGEGGDESLYLRRGAAASAGSHDAASATAGSSDEVISVEAIPGVYHIQVAPAPGAEGFERATLRASFLPATALRAGDEVAVSGSAGGAQIFVVDAPEAPLLEIALSGGSGDADLFVRAGGPPTDRRFDWASYSSASEEIVLVPRAAAGRYYVAIYAASAFEGANLAVRVHPSLATETPLPLGHSATVAFGPGDPLRFTVEVPPTAIDGSFSFAGDGVDLYLRRGGLPSVDNHDHTTQGKAEKRISLAPIPAGLWHVLLVAAKQTTGRLGAAVNATPAMREGRALMLSGTTGSQKVLRFEAPADALGASFTLSEGSGDADLYVKKGAAPTAADHDAASERPGNQEQISLGSGGGTYYVLVVAASEYSLARLVAAATR